MAMMMGYGSASPLFEPETRTTTFLDIGWGQSPCLSHARETARRGEQRYQEDLQHLGGKLAARPSPVPPVVPRILSSVAR